jgi:hypothetical protein
MSSVDLFKHTITIILAENWLFNFAFKVSFSVNIQITKQPKGEMLIINKKQHKIALNNSTIAKTNKLTNRGYYSGYRYCNK